VECANLSKFCNRSRANQSVFDQNDAFGGWIFVFEISFEKNAFVIALWRADKFLHLRRADDLAIDSLPKRRAALASTERTRRRWTAFRFV